MSVKRYSLVLVCTLAGCPADSAQPSKLPKPQDPATDERGPDTVPPHPPAPQGPADNIPTTTANTGACSDGGAADTSSGARNCAP